MNRKEFMEQSTLPKEMIRSLCSIGGGWIKFKKEVISGEVYNWNVNPKDLHNFVKRNQLNLLKLFICRMDRCQCRLNSLMQKEGDFVSAITEPHIKNTKENKAILMKIITIVYKELLTVRRKNEES